MTPVYVVELCKDERITADTWAHVGEVPREIYIPMEDRYLAASEHAMREHGITQCRLVLHDYEPDERDFAEIAKYAPDIGLTAALSFREGEWATGERLRVFFRLAMRGLIGWGLTNDRDFFVDVGEMCVRIGSSTQYATGETWVQWPGMNGPLHALPMGKVGDDPENVAHQTLLPFREALPA